MHFKAFEKLQIVFTKTVALLSKNNLHVMVK